MVLEGSLAVDRLKTALKRLIARHGSLRTSFHILKDEPVQRIWKQVEFHLDFKHCRKVEEERPAVKNFIKPFDLSRAPLLRGKLIQMEPDPPQIRYRDFCQWQRKLLRTGQLQDRKDWWMERFTGELPAADLPTDFSRPRVRGS